MTSTLAPPAGSIAGLRELFGELSDLKRVRSAGRVGSVAERGFIQAWRALAAGVPPERAMRESAASALAAARLGDLDRAMLRELGLDEHATRLVLRRAFEDVTPSLASDLVGILRPGLDDASGHHDVPRFVAALAAQPRAGATCPGKPRLMLEPAENHAEHCWAVAVFGVLLAPHYDADPAIVFLAGLSHHLHNAVMPDSGFTGEELLGEHLEPVCAAATARALDELPPGLRGVVVASRAILADTGTPEGRAFHAADVIDRVMQLAQHLRAASLNMTTLLGEWELVHAGPVKRFHDSVLVEMGLA